MDLVIDVGNSAAKGALFTDGSAGAAVRRTFRLRLAPGSASPHQWRSALHETLGDVRPARAGLCSVVPAATAHVRSALAEGWALHDPFEVLTDTGQHDVALPFTLAYRTPATLGADRLAAAAAAWIVYGGERSVIVLDAGTALTCEAIRANPGGHGTYEGGAITPGLPLLRRTLTDGTAQLPPVPFPDPAGEGDLPPPIGTTTEGALRSGIAHGFLGAAEGLLHRFDDALGSPPPVVVSTGGWGAFLRAHSERIAHYDPHLVLRGVHALLRLNTGTRRDR